MLLLRFIHDEDVLYVGNTTYKATCPVRNELNKLRKLDQVVRTYPKDLSLPREPYTPRKFPTGLWKVTGVTVTQDPDYAPVKITTDAVRRVLVWDTRQGMYSRVTGETQEDAFYHLHYAKNSRTTLGCIRLNSEEDALKIGQEIKDYMVDNIDVWLEVIASRSC